MKRRIVMGSIMVVFLLLLVPMINAIEIQTTEKAISTSFHSYDELKNMDVDALVSYIYELSKEYPEVYKEFKSFVNEMDSESLSSLLSKENLDGAFSGDSKPLPTGTNQTMLEKIFWKIFNYRLFRLYISTIIFLFHQSKFTLLRTTNWAIKLLRLVQIGIILGIIDPSSQPPEKPQIVFTQDTLNRTLTVASVTPDTTLWSDIDEIGSGSCDPLPVGSVMVGDQITSCAGIIVLRYIPLDDILGVFEFE